MICPRCPHCRALSNPAALTLSGPPSSSPTAGTDLAFYREFGLAYDRARELRIQPRTALLAANPWMTASQCSAYLKRARGLGLVQAAARRQVAPIPVRSAPLPVEQQEDPTPAPRATGRRGRRTRVAGWTPEQSDAVFFHEDVQRRLENADLTGRPMTAEQVRATAPGKLTDGQAQAVLDYAVACGYVVRSEDGAGVLSTATDDTATPDRVVTVEAATTWSDSLRATGVAVSAYTLARAGAFPDEVTAGAELDRLVAAGEAERLPDGRVRLLAPS